MSPLTRFRISIFAPAACLAAAVVVIKFFSMNPFANAALLYVLTPLFFITFTWSLLFRCPSCKKRLHGTTFARIARGGLSLCPYCGIDLSVKNSK